MRWGILPLGGAKVSPRLGRWREFNALFRQAQNLLDVLAYLVPVGWNAEVPVGFAALDLHGGDAPRQLREALLRIVDPLLPVSREVPLATGSTGIDQEFCI